MSAVIGKRFLGPEPTGEGQVPEAHLRTRVLVWYWRLGQEADVAEVEEVVIQATRQTSL